MAGVILLAHINCSVSTIYIVIQLFTINNLKLFIMKKVFIVYIEVYDDFGLYMGRNIKGIYTTLELAQEKVDTLKSSDEEDVEQCMSYEYTIEENTLEGE